ncbi:hypothetical protein PybrP1_003160 [[Pythium] brassicae (nom. inval.)]|nr:hypothetical protein PybrP1_003160 [[Pythium] brassicae (nom. inval.)]
MATLPAPNAKRAGSTSQVWGYVLVLGAALAFVLSMYMMFVSKLLLFLDDEGGDDKDPSGSNNNDGSASLLRAVERDVHYCYLLPLTIPMSFVAFYANWVSLKFFRQN